MIYEACFVVVAENLPYRHIIFLQTMTLIHLGEVFEPGFGRQVKIVDTVRHASTTTVMSHVHVA